MTTRLGLFLDNAEVIDVREQGDVVLLSVHASGATKRSAIRGARKAAASTIPVHKQNFINETKVGEEGLFREQWMFTVSNNGD